MILPSKHISPERALFTTSTFLFGLMTEKMSISQLWITAKQEFNRPYPLYYHEFILGLDLLFILGYIDFIEGKVQRRGVK